jgi:hypothetical protein
LFFPADIDAGTTLLVLLHTPAACPLDYGERLSHSYSCVCLTSFIAISQVHLDSWMCLNIISISELTRLIRVYCYPLFSVSYGMCDDHDDVCICHRL